MLERTHSHPPITATNRWYSITGALQHFVADPQNWLILLNSKPATEGQNRPVPDQPIGTDQESRTLPGLGRYRHGPLRPDFRYTPESKHCSDGSARRRRCFLPSTESRLSRIYRDLDCGIRPK